MDPKVISTFGKGEISKQKATRKINVENRSTKGRNNSKRSKKSNNGEGLNTPGSWVDPKSSISTPNDAGKRPVHANGQSAGHWYTTPEGRRVCKITIYCFWIEWILIRFIAISQRSSLVARSFDVCAREPQKSPER